MDVRQGRYPEEQDKDVRFRTTYYFRTFDYCYGKDAVDGKQDVKIIPETDSLYRFHMTGKAHSFLSNVKFESGSLKAHEIDPFGSNIVYDEDLDAFRLRSAEEVQAEVRQRKARQRYEDLQERYLSVAGQIQELKKEEATLTTQIENLEKEKKDTTKQEAQRTAVQGRIAALRTIMVQLEAALNTALGAYATLNGIATPESPLRRYETLKAMRKDQEARLVQKKEGESEEEATERNKPVQVLIDGLEKEMEQALKEYRDTDSSSDGNIECGANSGPRRRGFQIMGPEGWRTFDQDERLLLAMYSSAEPLIETMKAYSDRVLNSKPNVEALLLPLAKEQIRISEARRVYDRFRNRPQEYKDKRPEDLDLSTSFDDVIKAFGSGNGE